MNSFVRLLLSGIIVPVKQVETVVSRKIGRNWILEYCMVIEIDEALFVSFGEYRKCLALYVLFKNYRYIFEECRKYI